MKHLSVVGIIALLGLLLLPAIASAKCNGNSNPVLTKNDGFESGTPGTGNTIPDWTVFDTSDPQLFIYNGFKKSGVQSLQMATVGGENRISQTIATAAGSVYTVCFWLAPGGAAGPASFRAQWDNQDMVVLKDNGNISGGTFVYYQFIAVATGNDKLSFEERNDPEFYFLDNVDVQLCTGSGCSIGNGVMKAAKKEPTFSPFKH